MAEGGRQQHGGPFRIAVSTAGHRADRHYGLVTGFCPPSGFLAVSVPPGATAPPGFRVAAGVLGDGALSRVTMGDLTLVLHGLEPGPERAGGGASVLLSRAPRWHEQALDAEGAGRLVRSQPGGRPGPDLAGTLPPFGALTWGGPAGAGTLAAGVDPLGFRHLYYRQGT